MIPLACLGPFVRSPLTLSIYARSWQLWSTSLRWSVFFRASCLKNLDVYRCVGSTTHPLPGKTRLLVKDRFCRCDSVDGRERTPYCRLPSNPQMMLAAVFAHTTEPPAFPDLSAVRCDQPGSLTVETQTAPVVRQELSAWRCVSKTRHMIMAHAGRYFYSTTELRHAYRFPRRRQRKLTRTRTISQ